MDISKNERVIAVSTEKYQGKEIPRIFFYFSQLVLIGLFLAITVLQLLSFPGQFRYEASTGQGSQFSRWFLTIMVGLWFLLAQVAIVALWNVLTAIFLQKLLTKSGVRWLNILTRTLATASGYSVGVTTIALALTDDPGPVVVTGSLTAFVISTYIVSYFIRHQVLSAKIQ